MIATSTVIVIGDTDSTATMSDEDFKRYNSTASTVDSRVRIPPPLDLRLMKPEKREREYWKSKFERMHGKRGSSDVRPM